MTNRVVCAQEHAIEMIDRYRTRWRLTMLFHVLKNGCHVEVSQLRAIDRIECEVVMHMIVAGRIARLMRLGRACQGMDMSIMFQTDGCQAA